MAFRVEKRFLVAENLLLESQRRTGEIHRTEAGDDVPKKAPKPKSLRDSAEKLPRKGYYEVPVDPRKRKEKY